MPTVSTLRPGLLVSLKTSLKGNIKYDKKVLEQEHIVEETGEAKERWETLRVISDPAEHEAAKKAREKAGTIVRSVCSASAFGLLCPEKRVPELDAAIVEARKIADAFNATAKITKLGIYIMTGRIAPDDIEAVRAINSEVRELMETMEQGIKNVDAQAVRDAANKARKLGQMLSDDANSKVQKAIEAARGAARKLSKAGEQAVQEIDNEAIKLISQQRTAFLDLEGDQGEVAAPVQEGRAVEFEAMPEADAPAPFKSAFARALEIQ